jgi:hypothetical protein
MLAVALSSLISFYIFMIYGSFAAKIARLPATYTERSLIGLVVSNTVVSAVSLFLPINSYLLAFLLCIGLFLNYLLRSETAALLSDVKASKSIIYSALPFIVIAFVVTLGTPTRTYDTGLYHLQAIKWIEQYAVVPGLANLHGRFGFNPNIFTLTACTSLVDIFRQEIFSINFTIYAILTIYFVRRLHEVFHREGVSNRLIFNLVIFLNIIFTSSNLSSPSPNFLIMTLPLFIFARVAEGQDGAGDSLRLQLPVVILCMYLLTVKLATVPLLLLATLIAVRHKSDGKTLAWAGLALALVALPWLARNLILSGWLVYPFPALDLFNFDWKVPVMDVAREKGWVTGYARNPANPDYLATAKLTFLEWFPLWWHKLKIGHALLLLASLCSPLFVLFRSLPGKGRGGAYSRAVIITSLFGVGFWLALGPAITFGIPFLLVGALSPLLFIQGQPLRFLAAFLGPTPFFISPGGCPARMQCKKRHPF